MLVKAETQIHLAVSSFLIVGVLQDPLRLQPSPGLFQSPCLYAGVRLVAVSNNTKGQSAVEAVKPNILPALLLVLLARLHAEQPAARSIVVVFVRMVAASPRNG